MVILQIIGVIFLIGFLTGQHFNSEKKLKKTLEREYQLSKNQYVKDFLEKLLWPNYRRPETSNPAPNQLQINQQSLKQKTDSQVQSKAVQSSAAQEVDSIQYQHETPIVKTLAKDYFDNTSLLLYFGAFLFISSVGLFVGFASVAGEVRTLLVALVSAVLYSSGMWLWKSKKKLKQVGETFIGIGMMAIPFVGFTAYNFNYNQSNGPQIWLATSAIALVAYIYTIYIIRSSFVSYLLIASVVSLFQSMVSVIDAPVYYFVWMLAITGIILQSVSLLVDRIKPLSEASGISGQVFIPIALIASSVSVSVNGSGQLAMTTALGSAYYALLSYSSTLQQRTYLFLTHSLLIITAMLSAYAVTNSALAVGYCLMVISGIHLITISVFKSLVSKDISHLILISASSIAIPIFSIGNNYAVVAGVAVCCLVSSVIAKEYMLLHNFIIALISWILLSYLTGQLLIPDGIASIYQALLSIGFVVPLLALTTPSLIKIDKLWKTTARIIIVCGLSIAMFVAIFAGAYPLMFISYGLFVLVSITDEINPSPLWRYTGLAFASVPIFYAIADESLNNRSPYSTLAVVIFLAISIFISLRHKLESARWISTLTWFLVPIALMNDRIFNINNSFWHAIWLYIVVACCLSLSRAIAQGRVLPNSKIPVSSMARSSSLSYLIGLLSASTIVGILIFFTPNGNSTAATITLSSLIMFLIWHYKFIEKSKFFILFLPLFVQIILIRLIEPYNLNWIASSGEISIFPILSSVIAVGFYLYYSSRSIVDEPKNTIEISEFFKIALITAFVAPFSFIFTSRTTWAMPTTFIVANLCVLAYNWNSAQKTKETIGLVLLLGFYWILAYHQIDNIQIYTHLMAALFALYAYIRYRLLNRKASDDYLLAMLLISTIPLAIQAISGINGEFLGLMLLLEQVLFLILGITIHRSIVTKWGLYVGIAAVLYQLRDLGWAMLAVLSLFIIGIAIFRALRQPDEE